MSDRYGPSEAWFRDAIARDPLQLIDLVAECRDRTAVRSWTEYETPAGRIDLLLAWPDHVIVVECKRDAADEAAVAQVLRYCGTLDFGVRPIAVVAAQSFTRPACFAAKAADVVLIDVVPAVELTRTSHVEVIDDEWAADVQAVVFERTVGGDL